MNKISLSSRETKSNCKLKSLLRLDSREAISSWTVLYDDVCFLVDFEPIGENMIQT